MTDNNTEVFTPASAWTALRPIQRDMAHWTADQRDAFLQALLDRVEFVKDKVGGADAFRVTSLGELQVKGINKTGAISWLGALLVPDMHHVIGGTVLATADAVTGITSSNSTGHRIYLTIQEVAGNATVLVFSDEARLTQVAHGALVGNGGGAAALTADGGSGIGGSITLAAGVPAAAEATGYIEEGTTRGYQLTTATSENVTAVCGEAGVADGGEMWVTIPGGKVLVEVVGGTPVARGTYMMISNEAGKADASDTINDDYVDMYFGRAIGYLDGAGPGTTVLCDFTRPVANHVTNVTKLSTTVTFAEFSGLPALDKDYDEALGQLPSTARLLGIVVWPSFLFASPGGGAITLQVGVAADHDGWTTSVDICSATGNTNPKDGCTGVWAVRFLKLPANYDLRVYIDAVDDLNTFTAGSVQVDLFWEVMS